MGVAISPYEFVWLCFQYMFLTWTNIHVNVCLIIECILMFTHVQYIMWIKKMLTTPFFSFSTPPPLKILWIRGWLCSSISNVNVSDMLNVHKSIPGTVICKGCIPVVCQYFACRKTTCSWTACNGERHRRGNTERRKRGKVGVFPLFFFLKNMCTLPVLTWNLRQMYVQIICLCALWKVCHSSAFQTTPVRSV